MAGSAVSTSASGGPGGLSAPPGGTIPPTGKPRPPGKPRPRRFTTPATLRLLLIATVAGCLAWGALAAVTVAQITAQQARGDETMNLVSRTGDTVFQQDFAARLPQVDALLTSAVGGSGPAGAHWATAARSGTAAWQAVNQRVHELDVTNQYTAETQLVTGTAPGTAATQFAALDSDISAAIAADQAVFRSSASAGSSAFGGLEAGVIVAAVAMAVGAAWGLSRRLAEYR
jgi:hypothetical protein